MQGGGEDMYDRMIYFPSYELLYKLILLQNNRLTAFISFANCFQAAAAFSYEVFRSFPLSISLKLTSK